jgi:hypothetical protein
MKPKQITMIVSEEGNGNSNEGVAMGLAVGYSALQSGMPGG